MLYPVKSFPFSLDCIFMTEFQYTLNISPGPKLYAIIWMLIKITDSGSRKAEEREFKPLRFITSSGLIWNERFYH